MPFSVASGRGAVRALTGLPRRSDGHPSSTKQKCCSVVRVALVKLMPKLSIDITSEEHQRLKAIDGINDDQASCALADFLKLRIEQARRGELSTKPLDDIRRETRKQAGL